MVKVLKTFSFDPETARIIEAESKKGTNMSRFIDNLILQHFGAEDKLQLKKKELQQQLQVVERQLLEVQERKKEQRSDVSSYQRQREVFLEDSKRLLKQRPHLVEARWRYYVEVLGADVSFSDFKVLINN